MRFFYDIFFLFFALLYLPSFFLKGKHRSGFSERLGKIPDDARRALTGRSVVWVHGVSVGEAMLAARLAEAIRGRAPDVVVVFTTTTSAGRDVAEKFKSEGDFVFFLPVDFRYCVRRFLRAVRPERILILETEIWPNLVWEASAANVPVWIVNGRISDRALRRYQSFRFFMKPVLRRLSGIGAQDEKMRERFIRLGADGRKVRVTGNMKFDWKPRPAEDPELRALFERMHPEELFWIVAGSTHEGEEDILFGLYGSLRSRHPQMRLAVAPRHLDRVRGIEDRAGQHRIPLKKVSSIPASGYDSRQEPAILVIDRMGVLASFYELAAVAFVGGSLVPAGGHNPVEPAFFEKPVLFGPHMQNFAEMARVFLDQGAAAQVRDRTELEARLEELFGDPARRAAIGRAAKRIVAGHQGAVEKNLQMMEAPAVPAQVET